MKERVYGEKVNIDTVNTISFYNQRAKTIKTREREYTTVLLGDKDPDFSVKWDAYEKQFILPKLKLTKEKVILDIGCGIGRWAEAVVGQCKEYYGVDFSSEMIAVAKENIKKENCHFYKMSLVDALSDSKITARKYDIVLMTGVSMYINEEELIKCYHGLKRLAKRDTLFYFEESVGKKERLTLNHIWSEDLKDYYAAIYRTREEYKSLIRECMKEAEFIEEGYMDFLDKKEQSETSHWYAVLRYTGD
jgi:ribosomal protein L11 methyltransferase (prmA)